MIYCSSHDLPFIDRAGIYRLVNPSSDFCYRGPTHVLHLYEYEALLNVDGHSYNLRAGDVSCIPAGRIYSYQTDHPGKHWCIHFKDTAKDRDPGFSLPVYLPLARRSIQVAEQFRTISHLHNFLGHQTVRKALSDGEARSRLKALLFQLASLQHSPKSTQRSSAGRMNWDLLAKLVEEELSGVVTTAGLAEQFEFPPARFARSFKQHFGCTVSQYLLGKRIERAKSVLTTSTLSIQEVGASVGIGDPQHFNKQFRRVVGLSPSHYRMENRQLLVETSTQATTKDGQWRERLS